MIKLTVFFEDPFWIGVFEKSDKNKIEISRVIFGQEPKDYDVFDYVLKNFNNLKFSRPLAIEKNTKVKFNPKRMQREISKSNKKAGVSTKGQQAIKLDYEDKKIERKAISKQIKEESEALKFQKKKEKKKQKNKGH